MKTLTKKYDYEKVRSGKKIIGSISGWKPIPEEDLSSWILM